MPRPFKKNEFMKKTIELIPVENGELNPDFSKAAQAERVQVKYKKAMAENKYTGKKFSCLLEENEHLGRRIRVHFEGDDRRLYTAQPVQVRTAKGRPFPNINDYNISLIDATFFAFAALDWLIRLIFGEREPANTPL